MRSNRGRRYREKVSRGSPVRSGASERTAEKSLGGESPAKQSPSTPVRTVQRICCRPAARRQLASDEVVCVSSTRHLRDSLSLVPPTPQELPRQCLIAGHSVVALVPRASNTCSHPTLGLQVLLASPTAARRTRAVVAGLLPAADRFDLARGVWSSLRCATSLAFLDGVARKSRDFPCRLRNVRSLAKCTPCSPVQVHRKM